MKKEIQTNKAGTPVAFYSQGIEINGMLFISGQIGLNPETSQLVTSTFRSEVQQVFSNLQNVIEAAEYSISDIIKAEVFLTEIDFFKEFNELYTEFFKEVSIKPTRQTVCVKALPREARIEISATCLKSE